VELALTVSLVVLVTAVLVGALGYLIDRTAER
jgi:F0F1-type ATP synthase assembly protein I